MDGQNNLNTCNSFSTIPYYKNIDDLDCLKARNNLIISYYFVHVMYISLNIIIVLFTFLLVSHTLNLHIYFLHVIYIYFLVCIIAIIRDDLNSVKICTFICPYKHYKTKYAIIKCIKLLNYQET